MVPQTENFCYKVLPKAALETQICSCCLISNWRETALFSLPLWLNSKGVGDNWVLFLFVMVSLFCEIVTYICQWREADIREVMQSVQGHIPLGVWVILCLVIVLLKIFWSIRLCKLKNPNTGHEKLIARPLLIHTLFL